MITDIQKASVLKRIAAGIFDAILLCILAVGFAWLLMTLCGYNSYDAQLKEDYARYEQQYGVSFDTTEYEYNALSDEQKQIYREAVDACNADSKVQKNFSILVNMILITATFSILLAVIAVELIVPLLLKNGQTVGKKIFGIGLVRVDGVQITGFQLFVRTILGKFTVEIMIPVYIILMIFFGIPVGIFGVILLGAILLTQLIMIIVTRTNSLIHDSMAGTVAVDISSQMIFRTTEDLIAYKKKIHAEQAARSNYK